MGVCVVAPMRWTPALCVVRPLRRIPSSSAVMCVGTVALTFSWEVLRPVSTPREVCVEWAGNRIVQGEVYQDGDGKWAPRPREMHENVMKGALFQHFASPLSLSPREEPRRFPIARRKKRRTSSETPAIRPIRKRPADGSAGPLRPAVGRRSGVIQARRLSRVSWPAWPSSRASGCG